MTAIACLLLTGPGLEAQETRTQAEWVSYAGKAGPGSGKRVVLVSGDEEYRSEEGLPQLGKILAEHHGFDCSVLFAIDPETGAIDPNNQNNIPGLELLEDADLMIIMTRFRNLPDAQMQHIVEYCQSGKPIIGMRTATHAFRMPADATYSRWGSGNKDWDGGFGRQILGEDWVNHHGQHGGQSTRGIIAESASDHPIVRGCEDIWGPTDVYGIKLPLRENFQPLILGQVLAGMSPGDEAIEGEKNAPMMPVAWCGSYAIEEGKSARIFTTTMGASQDLLSDGLRRLLVNASYWALRMEAEIPEQSKVDLVGEYEPTAFGFNAFTKGVMPADHKR
ncbi:MAG: ThuA domain-containing protein [Planctomycetota bacterium]